MADAEPHFVPDPTRTDGAPADLLPHVKKAFDAKQLCRCHGRLGMEMTETVVFVGRKATSTIKAVNRMASLAHADNHMAQMRENVNMYKEESARVRFCLASFRVTDEFVLNLQENLEVCYFSFILCTGLLNGCFRT